MYPRGEHMLLDSNKGSMRIEIKDIVVVGHTTARHWAADDYAATFVIVGGTGAYAGLETMSGVATGSLRWSTSGSRGDTVPTKPVTYDFAWELEASVP